MDAAGHDRSAQPTAGELRALRQRARSHLAAGRFLPALRAYDRLIGLGGATPEMWREAGDALCAVGEYAQALEPYRRALSDGNDPDGEVRHQLGRALYRLGLVDRAVEELNSAKAASPTFPALLALATILPGAPSATPGDVLSARRAVSEWLRPDATKRATGPDRPAPRARKDVRRRREPSSARPLRVGYACAFFDRPNYMKPVWGVINAHDRAAFELHLFADCPPDAGLTGYAADPRDTIHFTADLSNDELGSRLDRCELDVVVDLNGYSAPTRLPLWVQPRRARTIAWFAMYGTTGLDGVDVIVGDRVAIEPGEDDLFTESVHRLPVCYLTFQPDAEAPAVAPLPSRRGAPFTFGSLAPLYKLTDPVVAAWSRILEGAPESRLLLGSAALGSVCNRDHLLGRFAAHGVGADRLLLRGPADHLDFLRYYDDIDISLDTYPYNGGTTTMESLWQGVPVLTTYGDRWVGRISASLLGSAGLDRFVFETEQGLIGAALAFASPGRADELAELRAGLREHTRRSSLCDSAALARALEALYQDG